MAEQNYTEEIDMRTVYGVFQSSYLKFKVLIYKTFRFIFRNIIWLAGVIIVGFIIGWILDDDLKNYEGTAIVHINFNSANIIYEEINLLNEKLKEGDTIFLKDHGFLYNTEALLSSIEIEPIVDFENILPRRIPINERYLQTIFEKSKFEDDLLTSDVFIPKYKKHRIKLTSKIDETAVVFDALMKYLNSNELLNQIKDVSISSTKYMLEENRFTIKAIDSILISLGKTTPSNYRSDQIYINQFENTNFHLVLQEKSLLMEENKGLTTELLQKDFVVKLNNRPALITKTTVIQKKKIILPLLAVFLFLLISSLRYFYVEGMKLEKRKI